MTPRCHQGASGGLKRVLPARSRVYMSFSPTSVCLTIPRAEATGLRQVTRRDRARARAQVVTRVRAARRGAILKTKRGMSECARSVTSIFFSFCERLIFEPLQTVLTLTWSTRASVYPPPLQSCTTNFCRSFLIFFFFPFFFFFFLNSAPLR